MTSHTNHSHPTTDRQGRPLDWAADELDIDPQLIAYLERPVTLRLRSDLDPITLPAYTEVFVRQSGFENSNRAVYVYCVRNPRISFSAYKSALLVP